MDNTTTQVTRYGMIVAQGWRDGNRWHHIGFTFASLNQGSSITVLFVHAATTGRNNGITGFEVLRYELLGWVGALDSGLLARRGEEALANGDLYLLRICTALAVGPQPI